MPGWPVTTGWQVVSSPALGDIDNDHVVEIVVGSDDNNIYAFKYPGYYNSSLFPWPMFRHDMSNTGLYTPYRPIIELPITELLMFLLGRQGDGDILSLLLTPLGLGIIIGTVAAFAIITGILIKTHKKVKELEKSSKTSIDKKKM